MHKGLVLMLIRRLQFDQKLKRSENQCLTRTVQMSKNETGTGRDLMIIKCDCVSNIPSLVIFICTSPDLWVQSQSFYRSAMELVFSLFFYITEGEIESCSCQWESCMAQKKYKKPSDC